MWWTFIPKVHVCKFWLKCRCRITSYLVHLVAIGRFTGKTASTHHRLICYSLVSLSENPPNSCNVFLRLDKNRIWGECKNKRVVSEARKVMLMMLLQMEKSISFVCGSIPQHFFLCWLHSPFPPPSRLMYSMQFIMSFLLHQIRTDKYFLMMMQHWQFAI